MSFRPKGPAGPSLPMLCADETQSVPFLREGTREPWSLQSAPSLPHPRLSSLDTDIRNEFTASVQNVHNIQNAAGLGTTPLASVLGGSYPQEVGDIATTDVHIVSVRDLEAAFQTNANFGLDHAEAAKRLGHHGPNVFPNPKATPLAVQFSVLLVSELGVVLWVAAILCFLAYGPLSTPPTPHDHSSSSSSSYLGLGIIIVAVIVIQTSFTFYQRRRSSAALLASFGHPFVLKVVVVRGGEELDITTEGLVPGDVVRLRSGDLIPADVRVVASRGLKVDNSSLTGTAYPVTATTVFTDRSYLETRNIFFMGTCAVEGSADAVVLATGNATQMSRIIASTTSDAKSTALDDEIGRFVHVLLAVTVATAVVLFLAGYFWVRPTFPDFMLVDTLVIDIVAVIIAYVPEGMPIAVTITLALVAKSLCATHNVNVARLGTIETLGSVNVICTDMTGTITINQMRVVRVTLGASEVISTPFTPEAMKRLDPVVRCAVLCNQGRSMGNATDVALLDFARDRGVELCHSNTIVGVIAFSSMTKTATSIASSNDTQAHTVYSKGAPETILKRCSTYIDDEGRSVPLTQEERELILRRQARLGDMSMRVIACADLALPATDGMTYDFVNINFPTDGMRFLGLVAVQDPPRAGVEVTIAACQEAGIRVMMITGDHASTAVAVAREIGVFHDPTAGRTPGSESSSRFRPDRRSESSLLPTRPKAWPHESDDHSTLIQRAALVTGQDVDHLDLPRLQQCLRHTEVVFARTTPDHKLKVVQTLRGMGYCVAVTGDGVNDAPALKAADVGIAMADGVEAARQAADMTLMTNDFTSVYYGIRQGRLAYDNLRRVIVYLLPAGSWPSVLPVVANVLLGLPLPLSAFLMIVMCVATDCPACVALVHEKEEDDLMSRPPRDRRIEGLVSWRLAVHAYLFVGLLEGFCAFAVWFQYFNSVGIPPSALLLAFGERHHGYTAHQMEDHTCRAQSVYFVTLVLCQVGNLIATKTRRKPLLFSQQAFNWALPAAVAVSLGVAVAVTEMPVWQTAFGTRHVDLEYWGYGAMAGVVVLLTAEIRKFWIHIFPAGYLAWIAW